jgi:hypothetical protein
MSPSVFIGYIAKYIPETAAAKQKRYAKSRKPRTERGDRGSVQKPANFSFDVELLRNSSLYPSHNL